VCHDIAVFSGPVIFHMRVHVILLCFDDDTVYVYVQYVAI